MYSIRGYIRRSRQTGLAARLYNNYQEAINWYIDAGINTACMWNDIPLLVRINIDDQGYLKKFTTIDDHMTYNDFIGCVTNIQYFI